MDTASSARLTRADAHDWKSDFFLWIPLLLASWRLAWQFQDPFISDWDGFDYTVYAVQNLPSQLGLGRTLFIGYNHLLWEIAHRFLRVPHEQAYLVFRFGVIAQSGPATVGVYALCKELTASRLAALCGAAIIAFSPFFITYSGRVMSEIPAFLVLAWALWWMFRSLRVGKATSFLFAAALVGVSANIREFAIFYLWIIPLVARHYGRSWRIGLLGAGLASLASISGMALWALFQPEYYFRELFKWWKLSARERQIHGVTADNFRLLRNFAYQCSCVATLVAPFALAWLWRKRELRALWLFGMAGLFADFALLLNHDLPVNPRYVLTGLLGLAAVSGWGLAELARWRVDVAGGVLIILAFLSIGIYIRLGKENYDSAWNARAARAFLSRIEYLPSDSVFIAGTRTPLVNFYVGIGARPHWEAIQPGAGWPDQDLDKIVDGHIAAGRPVYVDFDRDLWLVGERRARREEIGLEMIRREYELELLHDEFYRIVQRRRRNTLWSAAA